LPGTKQFFSHWEARSNQVILPLPVNQQICRFSFL
jgi:hypothetical protein